MANNISFGKFIMVALTCYLAFVIFRAKDKLQSGNIGTLFSTVNQKTVQGLHKRDETGLGSED